MGLISRVSSRTYRKSLLNSRRLKDELCTSIHNLSRLGDQPTGDQRCTTRANRTRTSRQMDPHQQGRRYTANESTFVGLPVERSDEYFGSLSSYFSFSIECGGFVDAVGVRSRTPDHRRLGPSPEYHRVLCWIPSKLQLGPCFFDDEEGVVGFTIGVPYGQRVQTYPMGPVGHRYSTLGRRLQIW